MVGFARASLAFTSLCLPLRAVASYTPASISRSSQSTIAGRSVSKYRLDRRQSSNDTQASFPPPDTNQISSSPNNGGLQTVGSPTSAGAGSGGQTVVDPTTSPQVQPTTQPVNSSPVSQNPGSPISTAVTNPVSIPFSSVPGIPSSGALTSASRGPSSVLLPTNGAILSTGVSTALLVTTGQDGEVQTLVTTITGTFVGTQVISGTNLPSGAISTGSTNRGGSSSKSTGKVVGIVAGVLGALVAITALIFLVYRFLHRRRELDDTDLEAIKWPELSTNTSTLNPLATYKRGGAGVGEDEVSQYGGDEKYSPALMHGSNMAQRNHSGISPYVSPRASYVPDSYPYPPAQNAPPRAPSSLSMSSRYSFDHRLQARQSLIGHHTSTVLPPEPFGNDENSSARDEDVIVKPFAHSRTMTNSTSRSISGSERDHSLRIMNRSAKDEEEIIDSSPSSPASRTRASRSRPIRRGDAIERVGEAADTSRPSSESFHSVIDFTRPPSISPAQVASSGTEDGRSFEEEMSMALKLNE